MKNTIITLLFLLSALSLRARVGETIAQCTERYGQPRSNPGENPKEMAYLKNPYFIMFRFHEGTAWEACYTLAPSPERVANQLGDAEAALILQANSNGGEWKVTAKNRLATTYTSADGERTAVVGGGFVVITHHALKKAAAAAEKKANETAAEGL